MADAHEAGGIVVLAVVAAFTVWAAARAFTGGGAELEMMWKAVAGLVVVQSLVGMFVFSDGPRPDEGLHLVYGIVAAVALPAAAAFSGEAPPRARAGTLAIAGAVTAGLSMRLIGTG